ncbi:MAG: translation initiation factor IF-2 [Parcubacteria group bacterium]|nr:translation initiation factor IF-2 [Parcubacteria group bacterium]
MNLADLARKLNTTLADLREKLPKMGFDIGAKAIKVDNVIAQKILFSWKRLVRELEDREKRQVLEKFKAVQGAGAVKKKVMIPSIITVRDFALRIGVPVAVVIQELMKNGIFASINERVDFDTCAIVADYLGLEVEEEKGAIERHVQAGTEKLKEILSKELEENLAPRPPVVVIMGHVDHGKTTLLDTIRSTHIAAGESGGITQHIGAYQIIKKGRPITFIDTPGHEAFIAMRSRGAKVADVGILVVAADDSVQVQTVESLKMIQESGLDLIVAINKVDKPDMNLDLVKRDLANHNIMCEDWGGKTPCVPLSAKTGQGIDQLLEMILLVADMRREQTRANPNRAAVGTIIESHVDTGTGNVATVLVHTGTLRKNDYLLIDGVLYGKVRAMKDWQGNSLEQVLPSMPAEIVGLKVSPKVGDIVECPSELKGKVERIKKQDIEKEKAISIVTVQKEEKEEKKLLNLIIKADVLGSLEALEESLEKITHPEVGVKIIAKGLGSVTESDILRADDASAYVVAFKEPIGQAVLTLAKDKGVDVGHYEIIFNLIDEVKKKLEGLLPPIIKKTEAGRVKILAIFREEKSRVVAGGAVEIGQLEVNMPVDIIRNQETAGSAKVTRLKLGPREVTEAKSGQECGMELAGKDIKVKVGDEVIGYKEETIKRTLE